MSDKKKELTPEELRKASGGLRAPGNDPTPDVTSDKDGGGGGTDPTDAGGGDIPKGSDQGTRGTVN